MSPVASHSEELKDHAIGRQDAAGLQAVGVEAYRGAKEGTHIVEEMWLKNEARRCARRLVILFLEKCV